MTQLAAGKPIGPVILANIADFLHQRNLLLSKQWCVPIVNLTLQSHMRYWVRVKRISRRTRLASGQNLCYTAGTSKQCIGLALTISRSGEYATALHISRTATCTAEHHQQQLTVVF